MDDKKNIILAVLLTAAILFGWPYISEHFFPAANPPATKIEGGKTTPLTPAGEAPAQDASTAIRDRALVLKETPRVAIRTPKIIGSINLKGARIDDVVLPTYKETIAKDSPAIRLYSPSGTKDAYFAGFGWQGEGIKTPDANTVWTASGTELTPTSPVTLSWNNGAGQNFEIRYSIDENYMISAAQKVSNSGTGAIAVKSYGYVSRATPSADPDTWTIHVGPMGVFNGAANYDVNYKDLEKGPASQLPIDRRLDRLHRQILAVGADPRPEGRLHRPDAQGCRHPVPDRHRAGAGHAGAGQGDDPDQPAVCRREGSEDAAGL